MTTAITQADITSRLDYEPGTGLFVRRFSAGRFKAGSVAGARTPAGYISIGVNGSLYLAHRLAWFVSCGTWPAECLDHINGDRSDNRLCNLREATPAENQQNRKKQRTTSDTSSIHIGVTWYVPLRKWQARISVNGKAIHLGYFRLEDDAARAYQGAKAKLHTFNPKIRAGGDS